MDMQLLPIGSVVSLEESTRKLMVIGVAIETEEPAKLYDYIGVPFPEGYMDDETMFLFMHKDIREIHFLGYVNAEVQGFRHQMFRELKEQGIIAEKEEEPQ